MNNGVCNNAAKENDNICQDKTENYENLSNRELIKAAKNGNVFAKETLIKNNMGLVYSIVRRFMGRGCETEDLVQIGSIGLIRAAERFDLDFNVKFSTYAVPMIIGEIKRFLRDDGMIKVSRSIKETAYAAMKAKNEIEQKTGREASVVEIANKMNIPPEELSVALEAKQPTVSLFAKTDDGNREGMILADKIESNENQIEKAVDRIALWQLIKTLNNREQQIIYLRYYKYKTQTDVAKIMGISQVQVSRIEKKILNNLKDKLLNA